MNFWETQEFKDEWEEMDFAIWVTLPKKERGYVALGDKDRYFKRKEKIQDVFEDSNRTIKISKGYLTVYDKVSGDFLCQFADSMPLLIQAVEAWKKMQEIKNDK